MAMTPLIRWMGRSDLDAVLDIEEMSFVSPWRREDFLSHLRVIDCFGHVAEGNGEAIGYMVTTKAKGHVVIHNLAVHPAWRRRGIGRRLIEHLILGELSRARRSGVAPRPIMAHVRETNLPAQLLLRACGLRCISVDPSPYDDIDEDAYVFVWSADGHRDKALVPLR